MDDSEFGILIGRARAGDEDAVGLLLSGFEADVRTMVRIRLPRILRPQFDSLDFVQAVWKSVIGKWDERVSEMESPDRFRGFLAGVTRNKVLAEYRKRTCTRKYDMRREEALTHQRGSRRPTDALMSADPTPSEEAQGADRMAWLTAGRSPREVQVARFLQQGLNHQQISDELQISERTVRRIIETFRNRWAASESER